MVMKKQSNRTNGTQRIKTVKKTYVTNMPNQIGAFLKASKCFSELGINITRVSYNKAVDSHTLFIDAEGSEEQLRLADIELEKIGYLQGNANKTSIVLLEFSLEDKPGRVTSILALINDFGFNISYISSQENGTDYQHFKMGLCVEEPETFAAFLREAEKICRVKVINYNSSEKVYDNSIFYNTYVMGLSQTMGLSEEVSQELLVHVNLAMQTLDEQGLSPYRTFDTISKFADVLGLSKGEAFSPRITTHTVSPDTEITVIEPPCGSNTMIIKSRGEILFVDSGYACYEREMLEILEKLIPDFRSMKKRVLLTHADVDHCGLLPLFDEIIASHRSAICLKEEYLGNGGFREQNPLHKPYLNICKTLTSYQPVNPDKVCTPWQFIEDLQEPLTQIGFFRFGDLNFEVYEGKGGHLPGEIVLIDYAKHIAITGDIYINLRGLTPEQATHNQYAPILMTSVDTDARLCAEERRAIIQRLGVGEWQIYGGHGMKKDYAVKI